MSVLSTPSSIVRDAVLDLSAPAARVRTERAFQAVLLTATFISLLVMVTLLLDVLNDGLARISTDFFTSYTSRRAEDTGIRTGLTGSLSLMVMVAGMSFPIGVGAGIYLEVFAPDNRFTRFMQMNIANLAGVPSVAEAMFHSLKHELVGGAPIRSRAVAVHLAEGTLAAGLGALQDGYPDVDIGSYPYYRNGRFGTSIVCRGTDVGRLEACTEAVRGLMRDNGGEPIEETISPG